jgi:hypothetical protein
MPFNLFITSVQGETRKSLRSPYHDRDATRRTVLVCIVDHSPSSASSVDVEFARQVADAPLGETVRHLRSGIAFRTEEA